MKRAAIIFLLFLFYQTLAVALAYVGQRLFAPSGTETGGLLAHPVVLGIAQLVSLLLTLALLLALRLVRVRPWPQHGGAGRREGAAVLFGFVLLAFGLSLLLEPLQLEDHGQAAVFNGMKGNALCLLLLAVLGPAFEELAFREGILRSLAVKGVRPLYACIVSALLFALAHGNLQQAVPAALLGMALGLVYCRWQDLRLCVLLHVCNNSAAVLLLFFPSLQSGADALPLPWLLALGGVGTVAGAAVLLRLCRCVLSAKALPVADRRP